MSTDEDRQRTGHDDHHGHDRPSYGAESPRELLAVHDPSKGNPVDGRRQATAQGHGVRVQWLRPTELAIRFAGQAAAGAVAAQVAAHRQVRDNLRTGLAGDRNGGRGRLAPVSAFGRQSAVEPARVERSVIGR